MTDDKLLERIKVDPRVLVGKPVVKGTRLSVGTILNQLAHGATAEELYRRLYRFFRSRPLRTASHTWRS